MKEDMRGLFYVVKGSYKKDNDPDGICVSGYDPTNLNTREWYQVKDCYTHTTLCCGQDLDTVLESISKQIIKWNSLKKYLKHICTSMRIDYRERCTNAGVLLCAEDIYNRCKNMRCEESGESKMVNIEKKVYLLFGDHFKNLVTLQEDKAYKVLGDSTPKNKLKSAEKKSKFKPVIKQDSTPTTITTPPKHSTLKKVTPKLKPSTKPSLLKCKNKK